MTVAAFTRARFTVSVTNATPGAEAVTIIRRSQGPVGNIVVPTASLPAASAGMDGTILIEDAGTGDCNLIVYAGGQRFRIDGGSAV